MKPPSCASVLVALLVLAQAALLPPALAAQSGGGGQPASLDYLDSAAFDKALSQALKAKPERFQVTFPTEVTVNAIPERFDMWLERLQKHGGKVELQPVPEKNGGRALLGGLLSLVIGTYQALTAGRVYKPVKFFDAVVHYKRSDGTIVAVEFVRRAEVAGKKKKGDDDDGDDEDHG